MKPLSVSTRLTILLILAVIFGASMIALSIRNKPNEDLTGYYSDGDKKYSQSYDVSGSGTLIVDSDIGNVTISSHDINKVTIEVTANGSEKFLKKFSVESFQEGSTVKILGRVKQSHFQLFNSGWSDVLFDIKVPKNYNLNLNTAGGNIEIENVTGIIDGETSGGNIELVDLDGETKMSTSGGNVKLRNSKGSFNIETSGGNMYADNIIGSISFETSGGNIDVTNTDGKIRASTSGGNVDVALSDNKGIDLSTSGGNIKVKVPKTISADVDAEASGGDVSCDLEFSGKIKDGRMKAKINGGGNQIKLETSGGDIIITPND
ncbi:MAG: hypothetical protein HY964_09405 [Ignavibacteriales bacterium]|nr:hypothetical protein [Ignavibacteriales bacterium]